MMMRYEFYIGAYGKLCSTYICLEYNRLSTFTIKKSILKKILSFDKAMAMQSNKKKTVQKMLPADF